MVSLTHWSSLAEELGLTQPGKGEEGEALWLMQRVLRTGVDCCLTPRQHRIVRLYYYQRMTMPQIALELKLNVSTVSRHLKRARERLAAFARQMDYLTQTPGPQ